MLAHHTSPLNNLLRKDVPWVSSEEAQLAFDNINKVLTSLPVLAKYDQKLPLGIACA